MNDPGKAYHEMLALVQRLNKRDTRLHLACYGTEIVVGCAPTNDPLELVLHADGTWEVRDG